MEAPWLGFTFEDITPCLQWMQQFVAMSPYTINDSKPAYFHNPVQTTNQHLTLFRLARQHTAYVETVAFEIDAS